MAATYKLNTDGSMINNKILGGGVIRDSKGEVVVAYTANGEQGNAFDAEVFAFLHGIRLATDMKIIDIIVEKNSKDLVDTYQNKYKFRWSAAHYLKEAVDTMSYININYVPQEQNRVAD